MQSLLWSESARLFASNLGGAAHTSLSQGFMSTSKAVSLVAGDRKIVMLRGRFWATYPSVAVGLKSNSESRWRGPVLRTRKRVTFVTLALPALRRLVS